MNGFRYGIGKMYKNNHTLIFEGQFVNEIKNGTGREFDDSGNIIFEGEFVKDDRRIKK